jgi:type 1 glutamine amidotransferase
MVFLACLPGNAGESDASASRKVRVLVVVGGHEFETNQFQQMFRELPGIAFDMVQHPKAHAFFKAQAAAKYDALVFYDMWQEISEEAKTDLVSLVKGGKGLVALHHCLGSYQKWDEYTAMIGGKYHLDKWTKDGVEQPGSTYKHDVVFKVRVAAGNHPITRGVTDFEIHDETYGKFEVRPSVQPLLATDEPTSGSTLAWAKEYGRGRVVYLQLGHDHLAYENPNFRLLLRQAIAWVAKNN